MPDYDLPTEVGDAMNMAKDKFPGKKLPDKFTPLHALVHGQSDPRVVADALTVDEYKTMLNAQDGDGMTALMYAAKDLKGDIAKELVLAGADKTLTTKPKTALDIFETALKEDPEAIEASIKDAVRENFKAGRRRKTRARKTKRRQTRRRR